MKIFKWNLTLPKFTKKKDDKMEVWRLTNYIKDLKTLQELITTYDIKGKFDVIEDIINSLQNKEFVDYNFSNLEFWVDGSFKGTLPKETSYSYTVINCDNRVSLTTPLLPTHDCLHFFSLDLKITLKKSRTNSSDARYSSWHLDKEKSPEICRYTHPIYHFQFGGKKLEYLEADLGLLNSPRLPHPPMDVILLFHFILHNFYDNVKFTFVKEIMNNPDYRRILLNSKTRIWDNYFNSFKSDNNHLHYTFDRVFPLYSN